VDASTSAVAGSVTFYARNGQPASPQGSYIGESEGSPVAVVAAQVPPGTRSVTMHFTDGASDRATPLPGSWAVLAARVKAPPVTTVPELTPTPALGLLSTIDAQGHTHQLGSVPAATGYPIPSSCLPGPGISSSGGFLGGGTFGTTPTTLGPPPRFTGEQGRIAQAFLTLLSTKPPLDVAKQRAVLEDYDQIATVINEAAARNPDVACYSGRVDQVSITDPTHASVVFSVLCNNNPVIANVHGQAIKLNGAWKVRRQTECDLLAYGGVSCPPG
jgi:hypothetical protein